jgi:hypothetical protein
MPLALQLTNELLDSAFGEMQAITKGATRVSLSIMMAKAKPFRRSNSK